MTAFSAKVALPRLPSMRYSTNEPPAAAPRPAAAYHPNDLPPVARSAAPNTCNPKLDRKYQQQQEALRARQEQERRKLQQKQDHQRLAQTRADEARKQQVEQKHQQQTRQLEQQHSEQQQKLQQNPRSASPGKERS